MRICLFDIDGTLLNTGGAGQVAMEIAIQEEFETDRPVEGISYAGRTDRGIMLDILNFYGIEPTQETFERFQQRYLSHLRVQLNQITGVVLPGVEEALEQLAEHDEVHLGLLTGNFAEGAFLKTNHFKLDHYFTIGSYGDHHIDRDDVARTALQKIHSQHGDTINPDQLWVIGDTPADVQCARAIGANVIAVATGIFSYETLEETEPDILANNLTDVSLVDVMFEGEVS